MRKELCRNFQRGSCRFGEACKFLHPQQTKPTNNSNNNPFGFGSQTNNQPQQQQQSNPFGFGVQGGSNRPNQFQPFENKWQRTPSTTGGGGGATQTSKPTSSGDHKCTDPAACKRVIQEDFTNERPMWKLTCYGHWKYFPCDITGDISYEELRAVAYEESKRGVPLHSIVERERNLQKSKIAEFDTFLRNPYRGGSVTANQSPFAATTTPSIFPPATTSPINPSPAFSSFNQQPAFPNTNSSPGPPNPFGGFNQQANAFSNVNTPQGPSGFQTQPSVSFKPASFGPGPGLATPPQNNSIFPSTTLNPALNNTSQNNQSAFKPALFGPGPGLGTPSQNNNIFPSITPTPAFNASPNNQTAFNFIANVASFTSPTPPTIETTNTSPGTEVKVEGSSVDTSIWLKEKWNPGEIPEQAPPDAFV